MRCCTGSRETVMGDYPRRAWRPAPMATCTGQLKRGVPVPDVVGWVAGLRSGCAHRMARVVLGRKRSCTRFMEEEMDTCRGGNRHSARVDGCMALPNLAEYLRVKSTTSAAAPCLRSFPS